MKTKLKNLKQIKTNVERNINNCHELLDGVYSTEAFFALRDNLKSNSNKYIRNELIEEAIKGNETFEYLYAWSKLIRMIDINMVSVKSYMRKSSSDDNSLQNCELLHNPLKIYLEENNKVTKDSITSVYMMKRLLSRDCLQNGFPNFNNISEFYKLVIEEDDNKPFAIVDLVSLLKAAGVTKEDLLEAGRSFERKVSLLDKTSNNKIPTKKYTKNKMCN